ncbi:MAG: sugar phosphate isomerase/epimerase [Lentisphaerae bacterium]|nr:sugar phosphate isomerase/epimerase [Lentisphaerota bacterium]
MKFGVADYGVGVWDGGFFDLDNELEMIRRIGFDGVERLTAADPADAVEKAACFRRKGLDFTTCRAPSADGCIRWTAAFGKPYVWIEVSGDNRREPIEVFCRRANKFTAAAKRVGVDAALHNHLGNRIESEQEVDYFMENCPDAKLLLDIGHIYSAGGDGAALIRRYASRIAAVHFKDVFIKDESIGLDRWTARLRFCELGGGNARVVDYQSCAAALLETGYDKWVFVEHDTHMDEPEKELKISFDILKQLFA